MISSFFFKKSLGQNFIYDEGFLASIVHELGLSKDDIIVEVGTGAGTLTRVLSARVKKVITYEIDRSLEPILQKQFADTPGGVELHFADIMKVTEFPDNFKLIANIPYYITTPLILKFMGYRGCHEICVLIQEEVANRIVAKPNSKEYGALSVTLQAQGTCKIIKKVPRSLFKPVPGVDSAFVKIAKNASKAHDQYELGFNKLVKGMFAARRKTALNALKQTFRLDTQSARELLVRAGIDETIRPEQITVAQFVKLSQILP